MRIGIVFPSTEVEADAGAIQEWTQATERMGFDHIVIYDHVVGANPVSRPGWTMPYDIDSAFYDPFAVIPFMGAVTTTIEFFTGVLILPQRQAVLVAKQAACADLLCRGRLRLGIGTGWNAVEYEALGVPWSERGKIFEDQIEVLRALWTKRAVTLKTPYHTVTDAGILPMPIQQPIPIWIGGGGKEPLTGKQSPERVLRRIARLADGLVAAVPDPDDYAVEMLTRLRGFCREYGRDPAKMGVEGNVNVSPANLATAADRVKAWQAVGATHIGVATNRNELRGIDQHLRLQEQIAKALGLRAKA